MDNSHPANLLRPAGVAALAVWRMDNRIKRGGARQRVWPGAVSR
jgi:hypothetical protein